MTQEPTVQSWSEEKEEMKSTKVRHIREMAAFIFLI